MPALIKKHSGFLMWVLVPSLLLVVSVFGISFISRPTIGVALQCSVAADCNSIDGFNPCRVFQCLNSACVPVGRANLPACQQCGVCGNGVCELNAGEGSTCDNSLGQDCTGFFGALCFQVATCTGNKQDFCCPDFCNGDPSSSLFDVDCACCGDSLQGNFPGEQCEPSLNNGTCNTPNGASGTCDAQCQCTANCGNGHIDPGEQCDPPNGTTCDTNCQLISQQPVCGNGIVETGEACEGTTCSVTQSDGSVIPGVCQNCQCLPQCEAEGSGCGNNGGTQGPCFAGSGTAGGSLIPPPVHPTVLAQWIAAFAVPGMGFAGLRLRRRSKNSKK